MKKIVGLGLIFIILFSCASPSKENIIQKEGLDLLTPTSDNYFKHLHFPGGVSVQDLYIDDRSFDQALGIQVSMHVSISDTIFRNIESKGFKGLFVNIKSKKEDTTLFSAHEEEKKRYNTRIHSAEGLYINGPGEKFIDVNIPYRKLNLPEGTHQLELLVELLPVRYKTDSSSQFLELINISSESLGYAETNFTAHAPKLYILDLTVFPFSIDKKKKDPARYDFRISGSGYPDLFWELQAGRETVFRSKVKKNTSEYSYTINSGKFLISEKDRLTIRIVDEDNGPFNKMDVVDVWEGNMKLLKSGKKKKLDLPILNDFSVQLSVSN